MTADPSAPPVRRVALLRGINLGAHRQLPMADLVALATGLGWTEVSSYLRSGNLLFTSAEPDQVAAAALTRVVRAEWGIQVDVIIRSGPQLRALIDAHRFADGDPSRVVIACCDRPVSAASAARLAALAVGSERVEAAGSDIFAAFPDGQASSKLAAALIATVAPATGTARNLNTIRKLAELLGSSAAG